MLCVQCNSEEAAPCEVVCAFCLAKQERTLNAFTNRQLIKAQQKVITKANYLWNELFSDIQFFYTPDKPIYEISKLPQTFKNYIEEYNYLYNFGKGFLFSSSKDYKLLIYSIMKHLFINFHVKLSNDDVSEKARLVEYFRIKFLRTLELSSMYINDIKKDSDIVQCHVLFIQLDDCTYNDYMRELLNSIIEWRAFADMPIIYFTPYSIDYLRSNKLFNKILNNSKNKIIKGVV
jgi:hypothetical protein